MTKNIETSDLSAQPVEEIYLFSVISYDCFQYTMDDFNWKPL